MFALRFLRRPTPDETISFYVQIYRDADLAEGALSRLRRHYPRSRIILLSDGDDHPSYPNLAQTFDAEYVAAERLYQPANGGAIVHRMLGLYLQHPTRFLLKMDTDTRIDRPFSWWPADCEGPYGTRESYGFLQGGCILYPRKAAERLHTSRILLSPVLRDERAPWVPEFVRPYICRRMAESGIVCEDWALFWACTQLKMPTFAHPEIHASWTSSIRNEHRAYAAIHPDKFLHVTDDALRDALQHNHTRFMRLYTDALYSRRPVTTRSAVTTPADRTSSAGFPASATHHSR